MFVYESVVSTVAFGGQKTAIAPLELWLQTAVSWSTWVLGTKPRSYVRIANALNH